MKSEVNKLKIENRKLLKQNTTKSGMLQQKPTEASSHQNCDEHDNDLNQNILPDPSTNSCLTLSPPPPPARTGLPYCSSLSPPAKPRTSQPVPTSPLSSSSFAISSSSKFADESEPFQCFVCNRTFTTAEFLISHAESDHDLQLCLGKLINYKEEDGFVRFFKSIEVSKNYIEQRLQYYPEDYAHVEERIKFRKLAQLKLGITSKQIENNMKKNDYKNFQYCGLSNEE